MVAHPEVLILGGGVMGLTTAFFLAQEGVRVQVLDKGDFGQESSWAGAGILPAAPTLDFARTPYDQLAAHSARLFPQITAELRASTGIDNGHTMCGGWNLFEDGASHVEQWRNDNIAFEEVASSALSGREPALQAGNSRAYYLRDMGQVRNPRHVKALLVWCETHGVSLQPGCPVNGFLREGTRIVGVRTSQGVMRAERFLLTAGAWSGGLLEELGLSPGIRPIRGQIVLLRTQPRLLTRIIEVERRYIVPRPDGRVLIGSTEEDVGFDKRTTAGAVADLIAFGCDVVPGLANAVVERCWAGLRPGSPDGLPFLGPVPGFDNLFVAAGHYRAGIQLSPATGLLTAQLLTGKKPLLTVDAFRIDRNP